MKSNNLIKFGIFSTLLWLTINIKVFAQASFVGHLGSTAGTDWNGWNAASTIPFDIKHEAFQPINFYTNAGANAFNNLRMIINSNGNIGIGTNFTNPLHLLDVRNGDINVGQGLAGGNPNSPQAYRIGSQIVLWNNGNQSNIFVGGSAGTFNTTGNSNSFVGRLAGFFIWC